MDTIQIGNRVFSCSLEAMICSVRYERLIMQSVARQMACRLQQELEQSLFRLFRG